MNFSCREDGKIMMRLSWKKMSLAAHELG